MIINYLEGAKSLIEVTGLTKRYDNITAVDNLSFTVEKGRIYGFLGPNGAGKSTTLNILTGCLAADEGQVKIGGYDIFEQHIEAKKLLGYLPEQPPLYNDMTPYEYLSFAADLKGISDKDRESAIGAAIDSTHIDSVKNRLIRHLSKGYRQRVGLAQAILGEPELIVLDEPTVGLDPKQMIEIRQLIKNLGKKHTVFLSSHILSEVDAVCDHVLIISNGKLVAQGSPSELSELMTGKNSINLTVKGEKDAVKDALSSISQIKKITFEPSDDKELLNMIIDCSGSDDITDKIFFALAAIDAPIRQIARATLSLEDVFLGLTSESPKKECENK